MTSVSYLVISKESHIRCGLGHFIRRSALGPATFDPMKSCSFPTFLAALTAAAASAQFVTIESRQDIYGRCGSPGLPGCFEYQAATCTDPAANILRIDSYT